MDRTAWIVVGLCVIGLVVWEFYLAKQMTPRPAPVSGAPRQASATATPAIVAASPSPMATTETAPTSLESVPSFTEKIETLRNSDVELRLTNRGGGITEAVMLNQIAEDAKRVIVNSPRHTPVGAMIDDPAKPALPEFTLSHQSDSSISCELTTPDGKNKNIINLWSFMSGQKLQKNRLKPKRVSKLNGLGIDLDLLIRMTNEYLTDLTTEQKPLDMNAGATMRFQRFERLSNDR